MKFAQFCQKEMQIILNRKKVFKQTKTLKITHKQSESSSEIEFRKFK